MQERLREEMRKRLYPDISGRIYANTRSLTEIIEKEGYSTFIGLARVLSVLEQVTREQYEKPNKNKDDEMEVFTYVYRDGYIRMTDGGSGYGSDIKNVTRRFCPRQLLDSSGNELGLFSQQPQTIEKIALLLGYNGDEKQ